MQRRKTNPGGTQTHHPGTLGHSSNLLSHWDRCPHKAHVQQVASPLTGRFSAAVLSSRCPLSMVTARETPLWCTRPRLDASRLHTYPCSTWSGGQGRGQVRAESSERKKDLKVSRQQVRNKKYILQAACTYVQCTITCIMHRGCIRLLVSFQ